MAWNQYIDTLKSYYPDNIAVCGIFGHNGSTWAHDGMSHSETNYTELTSLYGLYTDQSPAFANGITLNNERYAFLRIEGNQLLGKGKNEDKNPLCVHKTNQALVIAVGTKSAQAGQLNMAVGRLGEYLESQNY